MDLLVVERGLALSRSKAQALIISGQVKVDGQIVSKVGSLISKESQLQLVEGPRFVSRGGEKLAGALDDFVLSPDGCVCLDVGSSTGGFTDCLLQRGARKVFAVDVGKGQLDLSLRNNPKVSVMEERHGLSLSLSDFEPQPNFTVIDVSFISIKKIFSHLKEIGIKGTVLGMIKPQFEVGPRLLKKGVVRSEEDQKTAVRDIRHYCESLSYRILAEAPARIKGPKGNQEFFLHCQLD